MRSRSLAHGLVIGALALFAVVLFAGLAAAQTPAADDTLVQGQNGSTGGAAVSGPVGGANAAVIGAGPGAASVAAPSQSQQAGSNSATVNQSSTARSGDAVAGSQVTGVVGSGTVQNQNSSVGAVALSGPAVATNVAAVHAGPTSIGVGSPASVAQLGNNTIVANQAANAVSGDALSGSQSTGIVGDPFTVMNQNNSFGSLAVSGPACAAFVCGGGNVLFAGAGPDATSIGILGSANASQLGSNTVILTQASDARSGDALAGSQVTGGIGLGGTVANQNSARGSLALTGPAVANNIAAVNAGPQALSIGLLSNALTSQAGDNTVVMAQESGARSGDALAGSQVTGLVSSEIGSLRVQNQQSSDFAFAISGIAVSSNVALTHAGPVAVAAGILANSHVTQGGSNTVIKAQGADARSGDALAGSSTTGVVGSHHGVISTQNRSFLAFAASGPAIAVNLDPTVVGPIALSGTLVGLGGAQVGQIGNNNAVVSQDAVAHTGDALAGSQVTGAVGSGSLHIMNQNSADLSLALSGPAVAVNAGAVFAGPRALNATVLGLANASVHQFGSNDVVFRQRSDTSTGDAISGSQVTGVVGHGDVTVMNSNRSFLNPALSGFAVGVNAGAVVAGPGATALAAVLGVAPAQASQVGNNTVGVVQRSDTSTGDAVSGSQVTGVVAAGGVVRVMNQNSASLSLALSAPAVTANVFFGGVGPSALALAPAAGLVSANVGQFGNNHLGFVQDVHASTGDAVAGSQVAGVVHGLGDPTVAQQNASTLSLALSGLVTGLNIATGTTGPSALAPVPGSIATTQQGGDSAVNANQTFDLESGDSVTGSQIVGTVSGSGAGQAEAWSSGGFSADVLGDTSFRASTSEIA